MSPPVSESYRLALKRTRRRAALENREEPVALLREEMADFFAANRAMLEEAFNRIPSADPPLPTEEPWRSRAIIVRSALKNHGINICFLGADAPARIRPPVFNDGAATVFVNSGGIAQLDRAPAL